MSNKDNDNVFSCLSTYTNAEENFFTEAFAVVLRQNKGLAPYILNELVKNHGELKKVAELCSANGEFKITTQPRNYTGFIPDIEIKKDPFLLLIENKLSSTAGKGDDEKSPQHEKYLTAIKGNENAIYLFITKDWENTDDWEDLPQFEHVRWREIYEILEDYPKTPELVKEFREFMEEKRMTPVKLTKNGNEYAKAWQTYKEFKEFGTEFLEDTVRPEFEKLQERKKWKNATISTEGKLKLDDYLGMALDRKLSFGLLVYFCLDHTATDPKIYIDVGLCFPRKVRKDVLEVLEEHGFNEDPSYDDPCYVKKTYLSHLCEKNRKEPLAELYAAFVKTSIKEIKDSKILEKLEKYF